MVVVAILLRTNLLFFVAADTTVKIKVNNFDYHVTLILFKSTLILQNFDEIFNVLVNCYRLEADMEKADTWLTTAMTGVVTMTKPNGTEVKQDSLLCYTATDPVTGEVSLRSQLVAASCCRTI